MTPRELKTMSDEALQKLVIDCTNEMYRRLKRRNIMLDHSASRIYELEESQLNAGPARHDMGG